MKLLQPNLAPRMPVRACTCENLKWTASNRKRALKMLASCLRAAARAAQASGRNVSQHQQLRLLNVHEYQVRNPYEVCSTFRQAWEAPQATLWSCVLQPVA